MNADSERDPFSERSELEAAYIAHHRNRGRYGFSYRLAERGPQLAQWIGVGQRLLDLGCRDGSLTQFYAAGNVVMGVDIDQDALAVAKSRLRIETTWMDLSRVPFPFEDASFTVVVAGELLEHLPLSANVVQEVLRVLTPGGLFVGSVPNAFHWRARLAFLRGRSNEDPTHLSLFSLSSLRSLLEGFPQVQVLPVGGIGGRALPVLPDWLSGPLVRGWPQMLANDFVFRAEAPGFPKAVNG